MHAHKYDGTAVQVGPMKPTLKAPKSKLLKLENEKVLSNYAFEFNLRRYNKGAPGSSSETSAAATMRQEELQASLAGAHERQGLTLSAVRLDASTICGIRWAFVWSICNKNSSG